MMWLIYYSLLCRYVLYAVKRRQQIKVTDPKLTFSEVTKLLGQEWTNLPEDTKNVRHVNLIGVSD